MRKIRIRFEAEPSLTDIDVLVRASQRDKEVDAYLERIVRVSGSSPETVTATDANGALVRLVPEQIILVSVSGNNASIVTEKGTYTLRQTLQNLERSLAGGSFLRVSRSELINMDKLEKCDFTVRGELRMELTGGIEVWASRRCIPEVRRRFKGK